MGHTMTQVGERLLAKLYKAGERVGPESAGGVIDVLLSMFNDVEVTLVTRYQIEATIQANTDPIPFIAFRKIQGNGQNFWSWQVGRMQ